MLSRVLQRNSLVRAATVLPRVIKTDTHVCFCGCAHGNVCHSKSIVNMQRRNFQGHLGLDATVDLIPQAVNKDDQVALWKDIKAKQDTSLVLKSNDEIESYVLSVVKGYFRTTKKASVAIDSNFTDHGLDSLDVIELVIQVEDELGYLIDAEKLELFKKPKHFVNFITQMEAYKTENNRLPHEGIYEDFGVKKHFPGLPSLGH